MTVTLVKSYNKFTINKTSHFMDNTHGRVDFSGIVRERRGQGVFQDRRLSPALQEQQTGQWQTGVLES